MTHGAPGPQSLAIGDAVEICPYPKGQKVAYKSLGRLDGHSGELIGLAYLGRERIARVRVKSKDEQKNGTWRVPITCLKSL